MTSMPPIILDSREAVVQLCKDSGFMTEVPKNVYYFMYGILALVLIVTALLLWQKWDILIDWFKKPPQAPNEVVQRDEWSNEIKK